MDKNAEILGVEVMKVVKLVSGGIDSYIMSQEIKDGINLYIDFGQKYAKQELKALEKLGVKFEKITINTTDTSTDINSNFYINNRNLCLATLACMFYSPDIIYLGANKYDSHIDKSEYECEKMSEILSRYASEKLNGKKVIVKSPYWNKSKEQMIEEFSDKQKLLDTFSCYNPIKDKPCGDCPACLRRTVLLENIGLKTGVKLSERIIHENLNKIHPKDRDRLSRIIFYLQKSSKVTAIDIDGILCECSSKPILEKMPIKSNINKLNSLEGYKLLFTARLEVDRKDTKEWLKKYGVKYDALIMSKLPYHTLIDDRSKKEF